MVTGISGLSYSVNIAECLADDCSLNRHAAAERAKKIGRGWGASMLQPPQISYSELAKSGRLNLQFAR